MLLCATPLLAGSHEPIVAQGHRLPEADVIKTLGLAGEAPALQVRFLGDFEAV